LALERMLGHTGTRKEASMFAEQRSRLALLSALIFLAGAGLVGVGAGQAVAGPGASDPGLPPDCQR
jgi:hypothetical protein